MRNKFFNTKLFRIIIGIILIANLCIYSIYKNRDNNISQTQTSINRNYIDKDTQDFLFGEWEIDKLLGFAPIQTDITNYPNGQDVLNNKIIFKKEVFSSKNINKYSKYQVEIKDPNYYISYVFEKDDNLFFPINSPIDARETLGISEDDLVASLDVTDTKNSYFPFGLYIVNNERLILDLDAALFELKKVK